MELDGKHVAILGAGTSGFAAAKLALDRGAHVAAFDSGEPGKLSGAAERFRAIGVELARGDDALSPSRRFDLAVISPGIDLGWPLAQTFIDCSEELIGEIELAFRLDDTPVIAITGTNGKTTTTSLVASMLSSAGVSCAAAGNIGDAYSEIVLGGGDLDWIVLEASSFQLETVVDFAPKVAIWMNFAPDHMDRYATIEDYHAAKRNIFLNADESTAVIRKYEDRVGPGQAVTFSAFTPEAEFTYADGAIRHEPTGRSFPYRDCELHGKHNAENVMAALAVADELQLSWNAVARAIETFRAPAHRCEKVRELDGVTWINDSKSTNLHSLRSALAGQEGGTVLIVGGKDKGLDFSELTSGLKPLVRHAVCIGETGERIAAAWSDTVPVSVAGGLESAVALARKEAEPGDAVLFSPGTSSFDMFSGYEARGDAFRTAVESLDAS